MTRKFPMPAFLLIALLFFTPPLLAQSAVKTDKNLFALRAVAYVHRQLVLNLNGLPPSEAIHDIRNQLNILEKVFAKENIDSEVLQMLKDIRRLTGDYAKYGETLGVIDQAALDKLNEKPGIGNRFIVGGVSAGAMALAGTQYNPVVGPIVGGAIGFLGGFFLQEAWDDSQQKKKAGLVAQERWDNIQASKSNLEKQMERDYDQHLEIVKRLTARYRWAEGEGGLDATEEEASGFYKSIQTPTKTIDVAVLELRIKGLSAWKARRPRDPFTQLEFCSLSATREWLRDLSQPDARRSAAARLDELARSLAGAVSHVPSGAVYDNFRAAMLLEAGDLANKASSLDVLAQGKGLFGAKSKYAASAVQIWEDCHRFNDGLDTNGYIRMRKAFALVHDDKFRKGYDLACQIARLREAEKCPKFGVNFAQLLVIKGEPEIAITWLEWAIRTCNANPVGLENDPHLRTLMESHPAKFNALFNK